MGGKSSQSTQGYSHTQLPWAQEQNVNTLQQGAADLYASGGPKFFPGQTYAGTNPTQMQARTGASNYATGIGGDLAGSAVANDQYWMNPENIFNPSNIPGFQQAQAGVTDQVTRNLTESLLPSIRDGVVTQGALGGSRQGLSEALAVENTSKNLTTTLAGMNMDAYNSGLNMNNAAANRAPTTYNLGLAPSETLGLVGGQEQADTQMGIDEVMKRFNFEQLAPLMNLQTLQSLTGTAGQYGGTNVSSGNQSVGDGGAGAMQAVGAMIMVAAMMYSDRRLKKNIVPASKDKSGLRRYIFQYIWEGKEEPLRVGYMADEVEEKYPEAVFTSHGYKAVDYKRIPNGYPA